MLNVIMLGLYNDGHYVALSCFLGYAGCHYAECCQAECNYAECYYDECHYAECCKDECQGTVFQITQNNGI